jgi:guanine nucleotide-binding protein subunit alpha
MCFGDRKEESGTARSRELDKIIRSDEKRLSREVKLLLLGMSALPLATAIDTTIADSFPTGAGESGKSTVLRQMKLIYAQGFSKNEKLEWKPIIFNNIVQAFKMIHEAMDDYGMKFENADNEVSGHLTQEYPRTARS